MNFFSLFKRNFIYKIKKKILIDNDNIKAKSLDELFHYYESDKAKIFKKKNSKGHGFSEFYTKQLIKFNNKKINILEIGSFAGSSAASFVKYFPQSQVYCFDVSISNFKYKSKNIHVYGLDINDEKKVKKKLNEIFEKNKFINFDLIIDDGSHFLSDILHSLNFFFKYLKDDGVFVIEDFKHPDYYEYNKNIDHISVEEVLSKLKNKIFFNSALLTKENQSYLMSSMKQIDIYKGNLADSDICFIKKRD